MIKVLGFGIAAAMAIAYSGWSNVNNQCVKNYGPSAVVTSDLNGCQLNGNRVMGL